jgi:hypothetical protein
MIKTRQQQAARRQPDRRAAAQTAPAAQQRVAQPTALDDQQLKRVAGGVTDSQALPKGTW